MKIDIRLRALLAAMPALIALGCSLGGTDCHAAKAAAQSPEIPALASDGQYRHGKFVWADLVTDDAKKAQEFYSQLFSWKFEQIGDYAIASVDGRPIGGLFQMARPKDRASNPRWIGFISVENVQATVNTVTGAGGRVLLQPRTVSKRGDQAIYADSEGAVFGVMKSSQGDPEDYLAEPGEWIWIQLLSRKASAATEFYSKLAGYESVSVPAEDGSERFLLVSKGYARAAVRNISASFPEIQPTWLPFVRVKSLSETVAATRKLGGKVLLEPNPEFFNGLLAIVQDPTGAAVGVVEWKPETSGEEAAK